MASKRDDRTLLARGDHSETRPAHRVAGGVAFDATGDVEAHVARAAKRAGKMDNTRATNKRKQAGTLAAALSEFMTPDGRIRYND